MAERREPPPAVTLLLFALLTTLLVYPLHQRYLYPDQDLGPSLALTEFLRGGLIPTWFVYPSALTNFLRLVDEIVYRVGLARGVFDDRLDLVAAWYRDPSLFRLPARAVAIAAGIGSLVAVRGIARQLGGGWAGLGAALALGTSLMFVREHHHGMWDAPASACAVLAVWQATRHVAEPSPRHLVLAAALAGLAVSLKYNLFPATLAVVAAAAVVPATRSARYLFAIVAVTAITVLVTSPGIGLAWGQFWEQSMRFAQGQVVLLRGAAGDGGNQLVATLHRGLGMPLLIAALVGAGAAIRARERRLLPLAAFVVSYGLLLAASPLVLNRYALPLAPPLAVLAVEGLRRLPSSLAAAGVLVLAAVGLASSAGYLRLLSFADTRVEVVPLIEMERAQGARVVIATNPALGGYTLPDLPQMLVLDPVLAPMIQEVADRAPVLRRPLEPFDLPPGWRRATDPLSAYAGEVVLTSEHPSPTFAKTVTPPDVVALLERRATLVADLPIGDAPGAEAYELFDLNYLPLSGFGSLTRPGPRLRLWRLPDGRPPPPAGTR